VVWSGDLGVHGKECRHPRLGGRVAGNVEESLRGHVIDGDVAEFRLGLFFEEIVFRLLQDGAQILFQSLDGLSKERTGQLGDAGQVMILERSHFPQRTFHRPTEGRILFRALERIVLQTRRSVGTVNEYLGVGMIEEEIPDETEDDEDAVGRGEQRQTREPLGEGADQIGRDVSGGEEEVDQEEESRPVLGRENSRVRQQRVELLVKVGVLQIVSVDENENAVEGENADDAAHVEGFDEEVGKSQR